MLFSFLNFNLVHFSQNNYRKNRIKHPREGYFKRKHLIDSICLDLQNKIPYSGPVFQLFF
jgi:hypothetical protein